MGDLLFSALLTAISVIMYVQAAALPKGLFGTLGPGYFPKIVLGCLIIASGTLTLRLAARAVAAKRKESSPDPAAPTDPASNGALAVFARYRFVVLIFVLFFLYVMGMKLAGFLPATLAFMVVAMWTLAPAQKGRGVVRVIAGTTVLLAAGLYGLFTYAFSVMLPQGMLF